MTQIIPAGMNSVKVDETVLEEEYQELELPARMLYEKILKTGKITLMAGRLNYDGKPVGAPELKRDKDGFLFPVSAVIEVFINGDRYLFELVRIRLGAGDYILTVRIYCSPENLEKAEAFLRLSTGQIVSVKKKYSNVKSVKELFNYIVKSKAEYSVESAGRASSPMLIIDSNYGLIPENLKISCTLDGKFYGFAFQREFDGYSIELKCNYQNIKEACRLLESFDIPTRKNSNKETVSPLLTPLEVGDYHWGMVGGLREVKEELRHLVEYPIKNPSLYKYLSLRPPKGVLMYGPPGTGKTTIAKILASETASIFYAISPKDINSMWYGESEKNIGRLFLQARKHVEDGQTVIIFIDEIDGFYADREKMGEVTRRTFGQLCSEIDGICGLDGVIVIAATNRYSDLDPALIRPGRIDRKIFIELPDFDARKEIFDIYLKRRPVSEDVDLEALAFTTDGFSGAEIESVCSRAGYLLIKRCAKEKGLQVTELLGRCLDDLEITMNDLHQAIDIIKKEKQG